MSRTTQALLWSLFVLAVCSIPGDDIPSTDFLPLSHDKWVHAGLFFGVGWLWLRAVPRKLWVIAAGGVAFGIGIEIWQMLLPIGRSAELLDAVADAVGLAAGLWLGTHFRRRESAETTASNVGA